MISRRSAALILAYFLSLQLTATAAEKRCLIPDARGRVEKIEFIARTSTQYPGSANDLDELVQTRIIDEGDSDFGQHFFFKKIQLESGDCVLFERVERGSWTIRSWQSSELSWWRKLFLPLSRMKVNLSERVDLKSREYVPAVLYRLTSKRRHYGLFPVDAFSKTTMIDNRELGMGDLRRHLEKNANDLTVLLVSCPRNRSESCSLEIFDRGQWMQTAGRKFQLPLFGRSKVSEIKEKPYARITSGSDTPQGIYPLLGLQDNRDPRMGAQARLSIDFCEDPINFGSHLGRDAQLLKSFLPLSHHEDYWVQEFALAHAMGRCGIRLHAANLSPAEDTPLFRKTDEEFNATHGCLNLGKDGMEKLISALETIGVFTRTQLIETEKTGHWQSPSRPGRVFVLVKDE